MFLEVIKSPPPSLKSKDPIGRAVHSINFPRTSPFD